MCAECEGLGRVSTVNVDELVDRDKSLNEGAITFPGFQPGPGTTGSSRTRASSTRQASARLHRRRDWSACSTGPRRSEDREHQPHVHRLVDKIRRAYLVKDLDALQPAVRRAVERISTSDACPSCGGTRLNALARSSLIDGRNIADLAAMQVSDLADFLRGIDDAGVRPVLEALLDLLDSMVQIGLGYLSLDRESSTLSGGEAQRTKMVRHLGSSLTDVSYVFDEPTIGLHAHDVEQMNALLQRLRDKGNTVLVVEHVRRSCASPITWSTWGRVPGPTAERSSTRAPTRGSRRRARSPASTSRSSRS